jgi:recombination protein RecR
MERLPALERLTACLARLPGVGSRTAERMALRLVRDPGGLARDLAEALTEARSRVVGCSQCGSVTATDRNPCRLCTAPNRDDGLLCVVEDPNDILTIERCGGFRGRYHALMGRISPMKGSGPDDLRIQALRVRVGQGGLREVVLALNTDVEGDATASYIAHVLEGCGAKITRLAFGLPAGSGIMYSDAVTLRRALEGRQPA